MKQNINKYDSSKLESELGFTLLEVMISMVIFMIVTASIYGLLQFGTYDRNRSSRRADIMKNARSAIHLIGRDALNAGLGYHQSGGQVGDDSYNTLLTFPLDGNTERDSLTSIIVGNDVFTNDLQTTPGIKTDAITFAFRDYNFNKGNAVRINAPTTGSSSSVARVTSKDGAIYHNATTVIGSNNKYDLYLIEGDNTQVAVMATGIISSSIIDFAPGDPLGINQAMDGSGNDRSMLKGCSVGQTDDCSTFNNASLKRFSWISYKVDQSGTLIRTIYGNNYGKLVTEQIQEQPLAYNIKNFQLTYLLRDGTVTDNPAAGPDGILNTPDDTPANVNLIAQITVSVEVLANAADEQTHTPQSIKLTSTFGVRNLQYDVG